MCYKSPGARCYPHAKESYDNISIKVEKEHEVLAGLQKEFMDLPEGSGKAKSLSKKLATSQKRLTHFLDKQTKARDDMQQTREGVKKLALNADSILETKGPRSHEYMDAFFEYNRAKTGYEQRMEAYDKVYETVDGKLPSGYASTIGLEELEAKKASVESRIAKFKESKEDKKLARAENQYAAVKDQIKHANKTLTRIEEGKLSRFNAPPSPALKRTKRYGDYIKTASAARTIAQEHQELKAIGLRTDGTANVHELSSKRPAYDEKMKKINEYKSPLLPGREYDAIPDYIQKRNLAESKALELKKQEEAAKVKQEDADKLF